MTRKLIKKTTTTIQEEFLADDVEDEGGQGDAEPAEDGGPGQEDQGHVAQAPRGGARAATTRPAPQPSARPRARTGA